MLTYKDFEEKRLPETRFFMEKSLMSLLMMSHYQMAVLANESWSFIQAVLQ